MPTIGNDQSCFWYAVGLDQTDLGQPLLHWLLKVPTEESPEVLSRLREVQNGPVDTLTQAPIGNKYAEAFCSWSFLSMLPCACEQGIGQLGSATAPSSRRRLSLVCHASRKLRLHQGIRASGQERTVSPLLCILRHVQHYQPELAQLQCLDVC